MQINLEKYYELMNLADGVFTPVDFFMSDEDIYSVCENMRLTSGLFFPMPILLDVSEDEVKKIKQNSTENLYYNGKKVGEIEVEKIFTLDKTKVALDVFGTKEEEHPGVKYLYNLGKFFISGKVKCCKYDKFSDYLTPIETKDIFKKKKWSTVAAFQTRNIPHLAHEYIHRIALEMVDGLMIQPIVGWKKFGDYTDVAIKTAYNEMLRNFYPDNKVILNYLCTAMRYAGPREALLHAVMRKNYGCTHFIVGRDHAGVKNYYGIYDAQNTAIKYEDEIGIKILAIKEPYYCQTCKMVVSERTCSHSIDDKSRVNISGTMIRKCIQNKVKRQTYSKYIREEILNSLLDVKIFVE